MTNERQQWRHGNKLASFLSSEWRSHKVVSVVKPRQTGPIFVSELQSRISSLVAVFCVSKSEESVHEISAKRINLRGAQSSPLDIPSCQVQFGAHLREWIEPFSTESIELYPHICNCLKLAKVGNNAKQFAYTRLYLMLTSSNFFRVVLVKFSYSL